MVGSFELSFKPMSIIEIEFDLLQVHVFSWEAIVADVNNG